MTLTLLRSRGVHAWVGLACGSEFFDSERVLPRDEIVVDLGAQLLLRRGHLALDVPILLPRLLCHYLMIAH